MAVSDRNPPRNLDRLATRCRPLRALALAREWVRTVNCQMRAGGMMEKIYIIGAGVVGKATGQGFAYMGHDVTLVDVLPERVAALRAEGLNAQIGIDLKDEPETYIFLTLPTPHVGRR